MEFITNLIYFLFVLGVLVFVHEWGHFIAAKLTGMRAEIFSLGMGRRVIGFNKHKGLTFGELPDGTDLGDDTDYRISLLPFGGYVKVSGMVDESFDKDFVETAPQPWEFRSKNAFQKIFVLSAGVIMNLILSIVVLGAIAFVNGEQYISTTDVGYVRKSSISDKIGFMPGDRITSINGRKISNWNQVVEGLTLRDIGADKKITVVRDGGRINLRGKGSQIMDSMAKSRDLGLEPRGLKTYLFTVETLSPAGEAGMKENDTIISINGKAVLSPEQFRYEIKHSPGRIAFVEWKRNNTVMSDSVKLDKDRKMGVVPAGHYTGKYIEKDYNVIEAAGAGYASTMKYIDIITGSIAQIFKGNIKAKEAVGGPIMIFKQTAKSAERGMVTLLTFLCTLSISLALINILPFPALDGGHILIVLIEAAMRKELPIKVKMAIQNVGVIILIGLMILVLIMDILR